MLDAADLGSVTRPVDTRTLDNPLADAAGGAPNGAVDPGGRSASDQSL